MANFTSRPLCHPGRNAGSHLIGGWVGLSVGLDGFFEKIKIIEPAGNRNHDPPGRN